MIGQKYFFPAQIKTFHFRIINPLHIAIWLYARKLIISLVRSCPWTGAFNIKLQGGISPCKIVEYESKLPENQIEF